MLCPQYGHQLKNYSLNWMNHGNDGFLYTTEVHIAAVLTFNFDGQVQTLTGSSRFRFGSSKPDIGCYEATVSFLAITS